MGNKISFWQYIKDEKKNYFLIFLYLLFTITIPLNWDVFSTPKVAWGFFLLIQATGAMFLVKSIQRWNDRKKGRSR